MCRRRFSIVRIFKVRESGNAEFWIANLIVMASTVLGVYLAAQAGFTTALQFEVARSESEGYYLRRAARRGEGQPRFRRRLEPDLRKGAAQPHFGFLFPAVRHVGRLLERQERLVERRHRARRAEDADLRLGDHEQQAITFQLAPQLLSGARRYYDGMDGNMKEVLRHEWKAGPCREVDPGGDEAHARRGRARLRKGHRGS
jgi:hypothetical protein